MSGYRYVNLGLPTPSLFVFHVFFLKLNTFCGSSTLLLLLFWEINIDNNHTLSIIFY